MADVGAGVVEGGGGEAAAFGYEGVGGAGVGGAEVGEGGAEGRFRGAVVGGGVDCCEGWLVEVVV